MQALLVVFAIIGIVSLVLVAFIAWKIWRFVRGFKKALAETCGGGLPPEEINLEPVQSPTFLHPEQVQAEVQAFLAAGFTKVGDFEIEELNDLLLQAYVHPPSRLYGVLYDRSDLGVWSDVVCLRDGGSLTVTSTKTGDAIRSRPGHDKLHQAGAPASSLISTILAHRSGDDWRPVSTSSFVEDFERAYREEMAHLRERGGPSKEEIEQVAREIDLEASDEDVELIRHQWNSRQAQGSDA